LYPAYYEVSPSLIVGEDHVKADHLSIWAYSRMMDVVQKSLAGDPVDEIEVIRVVFVAMICTTAYDILRYVLSENDARVQVSYGQLRSHG
jgi:hypothetical protein